MKAFTKHIVKQKKTIDSIMHFAIGGSWDSLSDDKYPARFPALLLIDEETKHFDYVYPNIFRNTEMKHIWRTGK